MKRVMILVAVATLVFGGMLFGQEQKGEVIGTVVLEDGSAIPGVAVEATSTNLVGKRTTVTSDVGAFRFMGLPPGTYDFSFVLEGFKTIKQKGVEVEVGRTYKLDVVMETGTIRQEIVVTGKSPVIDVRKSASAINIKKEVFEKLPKGRNFMTIVTSTAGLNFETEFQTTTELDNDEFAAGVSFDGASASENTFYIDGVDTTRLADGKAGANVNFDFIEEVQVKSSGYAAEYGGSMGGVISVITRSGGNEFHGQVSAYFDGSILGHNPTPSLRTNPLNNDLAEHVTYPEDDWTRIEPGIGLGGYIIKDKLWFFGSFMPKFRTTTRKGDNWPVPDPAGNQISTIFAGETHVSGSNEFTRKDTTYAASLKLTGQVANNLRLSVSGTLDFNKYEGALPERDGSSNYAKDFEPVAFEYPTYTVGGSLDYTLGNNLMINASAGYWYSNVKQALPPPGNQHYFIYSNADVPGVQPDWIRARYYMDYAWEEGFQVMKDINTKFTATGDITYYGNLGGEHVFKAGVQLVKIGNDVNSAYTYDYNRYYWGRPYQAADATTHTTTLGYVDVREPYGVDGKISSNRWAVYLQDSWTIIDKLTLNLGVRLEKEVLPVYQEGYDPPINFDFFDKIAPRVGFAYDVFGDSSLKIFGSFGVYHDVMKMAMAIGSYAGFRWLSHYYDIVNPDWQSAYANDGTHPVTAGWGGGQYFETRNWRVPSYDTTQPSEGDNKMKPYQKNEFTFGIQKTMGEDWSVSVRFLHNYIINAIEDVGFLVGLDENYYIGNPGSPYMQEVVDAGIAAGSIPHGVVATKPIRKYTSVTLNLDRKFKDNWLGGLSYTWSRLHGNFAGLASSDEHGRKDPGVERYFDAWFLTYTQDGENDVGPLPTDRTHQFKLYGAYTFDWGLTLGVNAMAMSGTPITTEMYLNDMQGYYPLGRGNIGRNDFLWRIDLYAEYNLKLSDKYTLNFNVNVQNVTNNEIAQRTWHLYNDSTAHIPEQQIMDGFDYRAVVAAEGAHLDPRYLMELRYLDAIAARIGVKLLF
jgi:hypothetical protein